MKLPSLMIAILLSLSGAVFAQSPQLQNADKNARSAPPPQVQADPHAGNTSASPVLNVAVEKTTSPQTEKASPSPWWPQLLQSALTAFAGLGGALIGAWVGRWNTVAGINQKANELEVKEIQTRLNEFYGRFQQIAEENHLIAREFKAHQSDPAMRTLLKLLDPVWRGALSLSDQAVVKSLVENGNMLRGLIREKSGLVDAAILPYLSRAALHFSMLDLAERGKLENEPQRFQKFVYPNVLDEVLRLEMNRLNCRIRRLVENSSISHPPLESLKIPGNLALPEWF